MTANWRRKRRVRARMAQTGESYTAALRHLRRIEEARMSTYELRHGGVTDVGNVRPTNQDQLLAAGDLVAVADGMGGPGGGEIASALAIRTLEEAFAADPTAAGLAEAVRQANRAVWERAQAEPELEGMGTTIAAVALVGGPGDGGGGGERGGAGRGEGDRSGGGGGGRLVVANVGDSRAYLLDQGRLRRLTVDDSLVAELVRAGEVSEAEALDHPRRHILTQALGVGPDVEPHLAEATPTRGDRLLLCSDGLFTEAGEDEITAVLTGVADPREAADRLVRLAKDNGGRDNITAVVLDIA